MNNDLIKIIEEKGPVIAQSLQIAVTQVYEKLLWYIRVQGVIEISLWIVMFIYAVLSAVIINELIKKNKIHGDDKVLSWAFGLLISVVASALLYITLSRAVLSVSKVFYPEYYIINQILLKIN